MHLSASKQRTLSRLFEVFADCDDGLELRARTGPLVLNLLDADQYASYVWSAPTGFTGLAFTNMSESNLADYEREYHRIDPMTSALHQRRRATLVRDVIGQAALVRTDFYNEFLRRDRMHCGVNMYAWSGDVTVGDMRIWRSPRRPEFDERAVELLEFVRPAFTAAMKRVGPFAGAARPGDGRPAALHRLSEREREVGDLLAAGLSDKEIALRLGIGFATVRTHVNALFDKLEVRGRSRLASRLARPA